MPRILVSISSTRRATILWQEPRLILHGHRCVAARSGRRRPGQKQRDRRGLGAEGRLRLGPSPEFAIEIFECIRRAQRLPHALGRIVEGEQIETSLLERSRCGWTERRPFLQECVVGGASGQTVVRANDAVIIALHFRARVYRARVHKVTALVRGAALDTRCTAFLTVWTSDSTHKSLELTTRSDAGHEG